MPEAAKTFPDTLLYIGIMQEKRRKNHAIDIHPMKILLILIFLTRGVSYSQEDTRDWGAFMYFNNAVNEWISSGETGEKKINYIKFHFFRFWLMYYGPDAYLDEEAVNIKKFYEEKFKTTRKKVDFMRADMQVWMGINKATPDQMVSAVWSSIETLHLKDKKISVGRMREILSDFESWAKQR